MTTNHPLLHWFVAAVAATVATGLGTAQDAPPAPTPKATAWPKLAATDVDRVVALVTQFKKEDPQLHTDATAKLLQLGAGAAPFLMQRVHDKEPNENAQIFAVLEETRDFLDRELQSKVR